MSAQDNVALVLYPYTQDIFKDQHRQGDLSLTPGAVITDINKDGEWWEGSLQGTRGCFPSNYVSTAVIGKAKCVHNYYASKLDELNIKKGDDVLIYERRPSGWLRVICNGKGGLVPPSHVRELRSGTPTPPIGVSTGSPISRSAPINSPSQVNKFPPKFSPSTSPMKKSAPSRPLPPPSLQNTPPAMTNGPPPMTNGPPPMTNGPPPMTNGPPPRALPNTGYKSPSTMRAPSPAKVPMVNRTFEPPTPLPVATPACK